MCYTTSIGCGRMVLPLANLISLWAVPQAPHRPSRLCATTTSPETGVQALASSGVSSRQGGWGMGDPTEENDRTPKPVLMLT